MTMTVPQRLYQMLWGWSVVGVVYELTQPLQGLGTPLPETVLDRLIPYNPVGIWCYLAFFAYVPWACLCAEANRLPGLRRAMQASAVLSGLVYVLWPTTVPTPALPAPMVGEGIGMALLRLLQQVDTRQNCLPSLHAALTLLCAWALFDLRSPRRRLRTGVAVVVALAIGVSIVQLRRHVSLDLGAGIVVGLVCGAWCGLKQTPPKRERGS